MNRNLKNLFSNFNILVFIVTIFLCYESNSKEIFELKAIKVKYNNKNNIIIAEGEAQAFDTFGKKIFADKIIYDKTKNIIKTLNNSRFEDGTNILSAKSFFYDLNLKILKAVGNVNLIDKDKNNFFFDEFEYNENKLFGYGNNLNAKTINNSYLQSKNA